MNNWRKIFLILFLSMSSQSSMAAWSLEPSYFLRYERNDNIYLATQDNELAVTGGAFSPAIRAIMEEEDQSLVADIDLQFTRYKDHKELDRDEGKAGVNWRKMTELTLYGINASYANKSNLDTTLETSGIDQAIKQKTANISPNWQYQFTERWTFSVNLSYTDAEYDEPGYPQFGLIKVVNFINYAEQAGTLAFSCEISERDSMSLSYYQSTYEGESNGLQITGLVCSDGPGCTDAGYDGSTAVGEASERKVDYDYNVWQVGYTHSFEENSNLSVQAGTSTTVIHNQILAHYFDQDYAELFPVGNVDATESEKNGQVYNVSFKHKNEISRFELRAGRNRVASSTGGLDETDTAKVYYTSNITERFLWLIDLNRAKYHPDRDINIQAVSDYTHSTASAAVNYSLNNNWTMSLGFLYAEKDIETDLLLRDSSTIFFTMSWREPKLLSTN